MQTIYLDYNASTPIAPEVAEAMRPFLATGFGNPSSPHWAGAPAKAAVEEARRDVAALLGCTPGEVIFTSGGSEANNMALKGVFYANGGDSAHIVTSEIEHPAILAPCRFLERLGAQVTYVPVDATGRVDPDDVAGAITDRTILVSVMHANNEVGTIQPIADIARITRERGVLLHTDAAQSAGKIATDVDELGADILAGLDGVAASTGSACHEGTIELSPVLAAMGVTPEVGGGAIRFSLGRGTTGEEIETVVGLLRTALGPTKPVLPQ